MKMAARPLAQQWWAVAREQRRQVFNTPVLTIYFDRAGKGLTVSPAEIQISAD